MEKKVIVICGAELCVPFLTGISKYMMETLKAIDNRLIDDDCNLDIRLVYPAEKELLEIDLKKIKKVPLNCNGKKFKSNVLRKYVIQENAIMCGMSNNISFNKNSITVIHDIRPLITNKYDGIKEIIIHNLLRLSVIITNSTIVTVSQNSRNEILKKYSISPERVYVIPPGWEHIARMPVDETVFNDFSIIEKYNYYLSIGSVYKHKNYKWILEIAKRYPDDIFVIVGNIKDKEEFKNIPSNVLVTGFLPDDKVVALIKYCKAFLQPSKYEGFGLSPLEAAVFNRPLILSNASALPDVYGEFAVYFNPDDYCFDLNDALNNHKIESSGLLEKYGWEKSSHKWIELLKKS